MRAFEVDLGNAGIGGMGELTSSLGPTRLDAGWMTGYRNLTMDTSKSPEIFRQDRRDQALSNPALALQQDMKSMFHRFYYRLFLSFESSVPCTDEFTFRVPRQ